MATKLSDTNVPARKDKLFADFKLNFDVHPGSNDLQVVYDVDAVKRSIVNIIRTSIYERPFQPTVGSLVNYLLFDQMNAQSLLMGRQVISNAIKAHEPRAKLHDVVLSPAPDENGVNVTIVFSVLNNQATTTLELLLNKVR